MKKFFVLLTFSIWLIPSWPASAELEDILKGMLEVTSSPKFQLFHPGDKIYSKMGEKLYYSGYEYLDGQKVLLLTYLEENAPIILKFPNPGPIYVKELKLRVLEFNNQYLKLEQIF